ncbi:MAG: hypothetical protein CML66_18970 [Rhodobacteraceae bacterium]|nr:hypothetical protein [Paracoccaceae bacterium]MAY45533.1 hypothetical protein [Paracoccaceae bacterium]
MRITVSEARSCLGQLCARAQDPREPIVLTRHGRAIAALVSIEEVKRIWQLQSEDWGPRNPLTGHPVSGGALVLPEGMTTAADGKIVTLREAARQVWKIQMGRADERRVLEAGGLDPVEGGELGVEVPVPVSSSETTSGSGPVSTGEDGSAGPILRDGARGKALARDGLRAEREGVRDAPVAGSRWFGWLWR